MEKDAVIIGSGGAGLSAAIVAAKHGLDVLVIEKTEFFGGATALSGGGTWVPANSLARDQGLADSPEDARRYVQAVVGPTVRQDVLDAFIETAPAMLDYLMAQTEVKYAVQPYSPDYHPDLPGASSDGRLLSPVDYDGRKLGEYFAHLRRPLEEFNAPFGMMIGLSDMMPLTDPFGSRQNFTHMAKMVGRYALNRLRYGRDIRLTMGNALAARLLRSALDAGVELWRNAPMTGLTRDGDGRVSAVNIERDGQPVTVRVRRGVVLGSGGFSSNPKMRAKYIPFPEHHISLLPPGHEGDGLNAAQAVGAAMDSGNFNNAFGTVTSLYTKPDGSVGKWPHLFLDRPKPGFFAVNTKGERFGDEASLSFVEQMVHAGAVPAWLVCDHRAMRKYGIGAVLPYGLRLRAMLKNGHVVRGATLRELAGKIGVDADGLEESARRMNEYGKTGHDPDFGKGGNMFDLSMGDFKHQPNPCLGPVDSPPFYAVKIQPGDATTTLGLRIDARARVLDADEKPIPGLYASGLDMNSLWRGKAPGNGSNNTLSLTFGYIAGRELAGVNEPPGVANSG